MFFKTIHDKYTITAGPVIDIRTGKTIKKGLPPSPPPKKSDPIQALMDEMRSVSGHYFSNQDNLIDIDDDINVNVEDMSEEEYDKMEKEMNATTKRGVGYLVYAWNDSSGYEYWKKEGHNYIKVTAKISNVKKVDVKKLISDMEYVYGKLEHWGDS